MVTCPACDQSHPLWEFNRRELTSYERASAAGNLGAVLSALRHCIKYEVPPPAWLLKTTYDLAVGAATNKSPRKSGRAGNPFARLRQDLIHFARWDVVTMIRRKQTEIREEKSELMSLRSVPPDVVREVDNRLRWIGSDWPRAYECAAEELLETDAYGSPSTMKASYQLVERLSRDDTKAKRFKLPSHDVLRDLGLWHVFQPRRERKPGELFGSAP